ncbi:MAG TPA: DUF3147 family protein [Terriglobales bacterium]|nr:DUF3147 family protein [Terriglobales bacterium]
MHQIQINPSALRHTHWHDYAVRFAAGGFITAGAGIIAKQFGPTVGGLFLAFPAIFPASATLIEKHELLKKRKHGLKGTTRARQLASVDAAGAAMGSIGLLLFAVLAWQFISKKSPQLVLILATVLWLGTSVLVWYLRKRI